MEIDPRTHETSMYRTMSGLVVPRPIGWISSRDPEGRDNLAPYSFFNVVSVTPPIVMFSPTIRPDGLSDTTKNVRDTEEFVVNVVTHEFAEAMNRTSATLPSAENEFDLADLDRAPSTRVDAPRVEGIAAAFECELYDFLEVGSNVLILGEVVYIHVREDVTTDGAVDVTKLDVVGRLAGSYYDRITNRFSMERPD